jgi:hypothetical protein
MRNYEKTDIKADDKKQYQYIYQKKYYEKNKDKKRLNYEKNKDKSKRTYIKSGDYTKERLLKDKESSNKINVTNNNYNDYDKEGIIKEDKHYIFYEDKIYSKSQFKYLTIHNTTKKKNPYCTLIPSSYDKNDKHMIVTNSYAKYYFLR